MKKTIIGSMVLVSTLLLSACSIGSNKPVKIVTDEYDFGESIESIDIDISFADVHIMASDDDKCHVVFTHQENPKATVEVKDDTLVVDEGKWTIHKDQYSSELNDTKLEIYLPQCELDEIDIDSASGDIILTNIVADTISIDTASGNITFEDSDAETMNVNTVIGNITGTLLSGKDFEVNTVSGSVNIPRNSGSSNCTIATVSGNVNLEVK